MGLASLGEVNREEDPNKELSWTCKYLGNCVREGPQLVQLEVSLTPPDIWVRPDRGMHNVGDAVMLYEASVPIPLV